MQPMPDWPNGLIYYTERDIRIREFLIQEISHRLENSLQELNRAIRFIRVETPCMVPPEVVKEHIEAKFPLWAATDLSVPMDNSGIAVPLYLRPESTRGTYLMFDVLFPQIPQQAKMLPLCLWQSGLSFRIEQDKTFSNLRFKQFYQLEFQLAYAEGTKADYHSAAVVAMQIILESLLPHRKGDTVVVADDERPFYSAKTTDLYCNNHEVVAISARKDFVYPVVEISCGLDRLTAIYQNDV
jgi:hypothetical protein